MVNRLKRIYNEYPPLFWIVVGTLFIDSIGSTLLFPFFALYITQKFGVGMTQAGILLGMSSLFGVIGGVIGGALADRFGRRKLILFGLAFSALSSLLFGIVGDIRLMYGLVVVVGLLSRIAAPAHDAMMADILPESKRQEGFGITRIAFNYAWIFGTALGGLIAARSFMALFVADAILSLIVAAMLFRYLPETRPAPRADAKQEDSLLKTAAGYRIVLRDLAYVGFTVAGMIVLSILILAVLCAGLSPYDPETSDMNSRFAPPSWQHPMGTDALGRDLLTRVLYGGRVSLAVGFSVVLITLLIGVPVGAIAGYFGGPIMDNPCFLHWTNLLILPGLLLGFIIHDLGHALVAYQLGDTSQVGQGQITLNPLKHIAWFSQGLFLLVGLGWPKPLRVNPYNFKRGYLDVCLVALSGPVARLTFGLGAFMLTLTIAAAVVYASGVPTDQVFPYFFRIDSNLPAALNLQAISIALTGQVVKASLVLTVVSLLPLPGLDGFVVLSWCSGASRSLPWRSASG